MVQQRPRVDLDSLPPSGSMARDPGWGPATLGCGQSDWPAGTRGLLTYSGMPTKTSLTPGWGPSQPFSPSFSSCYTPFSFLFCCSLSNQLMSSVETKGIFSDYNLCPPQALDTPKRDRGLKEWARVRSRDTRLAQGFQEHTQPPVWHSQSHSDHGGNPPSVSLSPLPRHLCPRDLWAFPTCKVTHPFWAQVYMDLGLTWWGLSKRQAQRDYILTGRG